MKTRIVMSALFIMGAIMILRNQKPRGIRNNNPLNIRVSGDNWQGSVGDDGDFVQFESAEMGVRAAARILKNYRDKYNLFTVLDIVTRWAPPIENDTDSYIKSVAQKVGISENQGLSDSDYPHLIRAMIYHENGQQPYNDDVINSGFNQGFYNENT